jgi:uncharacterized protein
VVTVVAKVSPSEDRGAVVRSVMLAVGGHGRVVEGEGSVRVRAELGDLSGLKSQLRDRHVRAAARRILVRGIEGRSTALMLNRQAAAAGVLALCGAPDESPLGPIRVKIESVDVQASIDWLTDYAPE